jgi:hypothetical protein
MENYAAAKLVVRFILGKSLFAVKAMKVYFAKKQSIE